jgi:hypothetical protein
MAAGSWKTIFGISRAAPCGSQFALVWAEVVLDDADVRKQPPSHL